MGTSLTNKTPASTYRDLLQLGNSDTGMLSTLLAICDGFGLASALQISTLGVSVTGTLTTTLSANVVAAGTNQGSATAITSSTNVVTTGTGGVILTSVVGMTQEVINSLGVNLNVYPPNGAQIGSLGANAPQILVAGQVANFTCVSSSQWFTDTNTLSSVAAGDGSLTITPTTGNVVAILNVGNNNQWSGTEDFSYDSTTGGYFRFSHIASNSRTFSDSAGYFSFVVTVLPTGILNLAAATNIAWSSTTPISGVPSTILKQASANTLRIVDNTNALGSLQANIIGNVVGNITGNVAGVVTGSLIGNVTGNVSGNAGTVTNGAYINVSNVFTVPEYFTTLKSSIYPDIDATHPTYGLTAGSDTLSRAIVINGGSGYTVGDVLLPSAGTKSVASTLTVLTAPGGVVATVSVSNPGVYTIWPKNPVTVTGGSGSGATFCLLSSNLLALDSALGVARVNYLSGSGSNIVKVPAGVYPKSDYLAVGNIIGAAPQIFTIALASLVLTVTTRTPHGFSTGQTVTLANLLTPYTSLNAGNYSITVTGVSTFTITLGFGSDFATVEVLGQAQLENTPIAMHLHGQDWRSTTFVTDLASGCASFWMDQLYASSVQDFTVQAYHSGWAIIGDSLQSGTGGTLSTICSIRRCIATNTLNGFKVGGNWAVSEWLLEDVSGYNAGGDTIQVNNQNALNIFLHRTFWNNSSHGVNVVSGGSVHVIGGASSACTINDILIGYAGTYTISGVRHEYNGNASDINAAPIRIDLSGGGMASVQVNGSDISAYQGFGQQFYGTVNVNAAGSGWNNGDYAQGVGGWGQPVIARYLSGNWVLTSGGNYYYSVVTNLSVVSNFCTLTTQSSHGMTIGQPITVNLLPNTYIGGGYIDGTFANGTYAITGVTGNTVTFALTHANVSGVVYGVCWSAPATPIATTAILPATGTGLTFTAVNQPIPSILCLGPVALTVTGGRYPTGLTVSSYTGIPGTAAFHGVDLGVTTVTSQQAGNQANGWRVSHNDCMAMDLTGGPAGLLNDDIVIYSGFSPTPTASAIWQLAPAGNLSKPIIYNGDTLATSSNALPAIVSSVNSTGLTSGTVLAFYTATANGLFECSIFLHVTTAGSGGTVAAQVATVLDDGTTVSGSYIPLNSFNSTSQKSSVDLTATVSTATAMGWGTCVVNCKSGQTIAVSAAVSGNVGATFAAYSTIKRLV